MPCDFMSFSTVLQSYQNDERLVNERLCAMEPHLMLRRFCLKWGSNLGPLYQQASPKPTEPLGHLKNMENYP